MNPPRFMNLKAMWYYGVPTKVGNVAIPRWVIVKPM